MSDSIRSETLVPVLSALPELHVALDHLSAVIDRLVGPDGCPWDKEQTPDSLTEYLVEECFELVDAIRAGDGDEIRGEMGDVAFLLLFLSRLSTAKGGPSLAEALEHNAAKMIRRHPHVFADATFTTQADLLRNWDKIKREEKADTAVSETEGVPKSAGTYASLPSGLPPLTKAYRIHSKAARIGFTWPEDEEVERQVEAEWLELLDACADGDDAAIAHELGDHLFTLVELGRRKGLKAAAVLDAANRRFLARFAAMENLALERGLDFVSLSLDEKDELWNEAKAAEAHSAESSSKELTASV